MTAVTPATDQEMTIDATGLCHRSLNRLVQEAAQAGAERITLLNVLGQRYIGSSLRQTVHITVKGTPGNDLAAFADGPLIVVHGNGQDGLCNTMNSGSVTVHGSAGDVLAYAMRGGELYVRDNVGYRVGIHMKAYQDRLPTVVIGGRARGFLGEYLAGGAIIVLGLGCGPDESPVGSYVGTGMHGGAIYVRGRLEPWQLGKEVGIVSCDADDIALLRRLCKRFTERFGRGAEVCIEDFAKLAPISARPYGRLYAP